MLANIEGITHPLELAASFKLAMSRVASSVALVTTVDEQGHPHGLAATSFLSVSMNPASALICVNRSASASPVIKGNRGFGMVLLQTVHQEICDIFSQSGRRSQRFVVGKWQVGPGGIPYLEDAPAVFCTVEQEIEHGTHTLIVANVQDVIVSEVCAPLVYMSGRYVQLHGQA